MVQNNINKVASDFFKNEGNPIAQLVNVHGLIVDAVNTGNTNTLADAAFRVQNEKGSEQTMRAVKAIARGVWPGISFGKTKTGRVVFKTKGIKYSTEAIEKLEELIAKGASIRGTLVTNAFKSSTSKPKTIEDQLKTKASSLATWLVKNNMSVSAFKAALETAEKEVKAKEAAKNAEPSH